MSKTSTVVAPAVDNAPRSSAPIVPDGPAPTDVINPQARDQATSPASGPAVARNLSTSQLDNIRAYAERGDMQGVQNYLDCGAVLTLLNALRDRDEANAKLDAMTGERNTAVAAKQQIANMFGPLLK